MGNFVHLHLHSEFSLVDSVIRIKPLIEQCKQQGHNSIAITDHCNLFAAVKFYKAAVAANIKPIFGSEIKIIAPTDQTTKTFEIHAAVLLCMNNTGYANLTKIISLAYTQGQESGEPLVQLEWLRQHHEGLILLSGGMQSDVAKALLKGKPKQAEKCIATWKTIFPGRYYLELTRLGFPEEIAYIQAILPLAAKTQTPVVASNNVRFLSENDFPAHEARVCIREGFVLDDTNRPKQYSEQQYLRDEMEMQQLFAEIPSALENSVEIAKRCNVKLRLGEVYLPDFPTPNNISIEDFLRMESEKGLTERLKVLYDTTNDEFPETKRVYFARLHTELDVIISMGFSGYFLIVADFIQWAKQEGIPVGPGRGSGAGSLVAYSLKITDLDPLQYDLLFERFLNPERVSMPDFDIDFCMEGRDRVIDYVAEKYGREAVSQIITFGTMAAKAVVRDVGRVLGFPYGFVDKIAKLIPFEVGMTLEKAMQQEEQLRTRYNEEEEVRNLLDLAKNLEGLTRNAGKHAGGVVISPSALTDFSALYCEPGSTQVVTQFDKDDVEAIGLVKFDFLGLRTLTIINWAIQIINTNKENDTIDINQIPLDDKRTFDLLKAYQTTSVFQLESRGMKDLISRLQPDCFEDIIALVALFRPGPLQSGMVDDFIDRKHGRAEIVYPHPSLEAILQPTYGVILYQEQVMQIAQVLAGYTLGGADMLRRAMGKKKPEEMAKQRTIFLEGAGKNNIDPEVANTIFDLMEKFAGYGFNKSHSAAYALVSYQTAWLKTHFPAAFMAAVLTSEMDNTDKLVILIDECKTMQLEILHPNINSSEYRFTVKDENTLLYGLGAIKGAGEAVLELIVAEREKNGVFRDLFDLCGRVDARKLNRRILEALISSGAMDCFAVERSKLFATVDNALSYANKKSKDLDAGQIDLFAGASVELPSHQYAEVPAWSTERRLQAEKESLGLYLSGHPLDVFIDEIKYFASNSLASLELTEGKTVNLAGLITSMRVILTKRGDRMAFVSLSDKHGSIDLAVFSDVLDVQREQLHKDNIIIVEANVSYDSNAGSYKLSAKQIFSIEEARLLYAKAIQLKIDKSSVNSYWIDKFKKILEPHTHGHCPVKFDYHNPTAKVIVDLDAQWWVEPTDNLLKELRLFLGNSAVKICY